MLLAAALLHVMAPAYRLQPIFTLEDNDGGCYAMNDRAQVLCYSQGAWSGRCFVWSDGKITEIPEPKPKAGETTGIFPKGISNDGTVVGLEWGKTGQLDWWDSGFVWSAGRGLRTINRPEGHFRPTSINDVGVIAGVMNYPDGSAALGSFRESGKFVPVANVPSGGFDNEGVAINHSDAIVGEVDGFPMMAFCSQSDKPREVLTSPLNPHGDPAHPVLYAETEVRDINDTGWIVGTMDTRKDVTDLRYGREGAIWSPDNNYYSLGNYIVPRQINDAGQVVGWRRDPYADDGQAILWDREHGVRDLDTLVPPGSPHLYKAVAINNHGDIVCLALNHRDYYLLRPN